VDVGRLCGVLASEQHATHQRIASYVKGFCELYPGMGFTTREEWVVEQSIAGLRHLLADVRCTGEERRAIEEFLDLASEEIAVAP
jgi:hypothetical protein